MCLISLLCFIDVISLSNFVLPEVWKFLGMFSGIYILEYTLIRLSLCSIKSNGSFVLPGTSWYTKHRPKHTQTSSLTITNFLQSSHYAFNTWQELLSLLLQVWPLSLCPASSLALDHDAYLGLSILQPQPQSPDLYIPRHNQKTKLASRFLGLALVCVTPLHLAQVDLKGALPNTFALGGGRGVGWGWWV